MKANELAAQIRNTFEASREAVRHAHNRAYEAQVRAQQMRESMRVRTEGLQMVRDASEAQIQLTERELTQRELTRVEQQSDRSVRENQRFVAVVSHELRQPLNAAMGAMSLLDAKPSEAAAERARVVLRRQLLHMSTLLDDLLDMSRLALGRIRVERTPIDLRSILQETVDAIDSSARSAGVHLICSLPNAPVPVLGDAGRLQQAMSNLLTNGIRYTPPDGAVTISLSTNERAAWITVEDTGQGIPAADLASVFEPFWRGHDSAGDGFGIGLALVRGIVELHDGSISVFSDGPGKGARFCVTLPVSASQAGCGHRHGTLARDGGTI
ncbi:MAG TPA: HAMP domain-containing sensor histidine kinase [Vicinamibacterales bacterium]|nr:HAMP domain-containing sensor histidine kinase [Vicinamibacterales bacterium]